MMKRLLFQIHLLFVLLKLKNKMFYLIPNELIFEILSYLDKCQDLQNCLFVCSQWGKLIPSIIQKNYHKHKLLRWWNIHQQVVKHQSQKLRKITLVQCFSTTHHLLERGYSLDIIKLYNGILVHCRTIFDHVCELFTISLDNCVGSSIKTIHINYNDDCCIHLKNGWKLILSIREDTLPFYVIRKDVVDSTICNFFNEQPWIHPSVSVDYHNFDKYLFYLSAKNYDLSHQSVKFATFDYNENKVVQRIELPSNDHFMPKNLCSQNYLYLPTEKFLVQWCSDDMNFQVYYATVGQKNSTFVHFCCTKKYGLLFWFNKKCYVGRLDGQYLKMSPFPQLDITFLTQFFNVAYCERNDELFVIYITSWNSSPEICLLK